MSPQSWAKLLEEVLDQSGILGHWLFFSGILVSMRNLGSWDIGPEKFGMLVY